MVQRGTVRGAGQPLPGAVVTATAGERKVVTTTTDTGTYELTDLEPGEWTVQIEMFGFQAASRKIQVDGSAVEWILELKPRPAAATPAQQPPRSDSGYRNVAREIEAEVRSSSDSRRNSPEVAPTGGNVNEAFLINGSLSQGLRPSAPEMALSGWGDAAGRAVLGNRSGSRGTGLQGSVSWSLRDSLLDARPYSITGQSIHKPAYIQNRFSAILGGPLRIPKLRTGRSTYFTLSYNLTTGSNPYSAFATVPSVLERAGDFSQSVTRGPGDVLQRVKIFDPQGQQPFPGAMIPRSRVNQAARGLIDFIPLPNQLGQVDNYQFTTHLGQKSQGARGTMNFRPTAQDRISIQQNFQNSTTEQAQVFGFHDNWSGYSADTNLSWTRTLTSRLSLSAYSSLKLGSRDATPFFAYQRNVAAELGILGTSPDPVNYGPPNLNFTNFAALADTSPLLRHTLTFVAGAGMYYTRGKHSFSYGFDLNRTWLNNRTDENGRGTFTFTGLATSDFDSQGLPLAGTGFDFGDLLIGLPQSSSVRFGAADNHFRSTSYSAYFSHDWRMLPNLSFSLGLRWELYGPFSERDGKMANLDIARNFTGVAAVSAGQNGPYSGRFPAALVDSDRNNFAPRFGVNYKPFKKHSLRFYGGYGVYYHGSVYQPIALRLASQPPFANTGIQNTTLQNPLRIEDAFLKVAGSGTAEIRNTYGVDRDYRVGYAQHWNFFASQSLPLNLVVEGGYLCTKGTRLDVQRLPNRAAPGSPLTSEDRRLIENAVGFIYDSSEGNSILHSGQVEIARRFHKGMSVNFSYALSKSLDNVSTFAGGSGIVAQDDRNLRAERGYSSFDVRHSVKAYFMAASPVGEQGAPISPNGIWGLLAKNWIFLGGITAQSGGWLTARILGNQADAGGTGAVGSARADATGADIRSSSGFFNLSAFALPPSTRFGNAGRNSIPLPAILTMDLAVGRSFRLEGRMNIELRLESRNFPNIVNITAFGTTVNASDYGTALNAGAMRTNTASLRLRF